MYLDWLLLICNVDRWSLVFSYGVVVGFKGLCCDLRFGGVWLLLAGLIVVLASMLLGGLDGLITICLVDLVGFLGGDFHLDCFMFMGVRCWF